MTFESTHTAEELARRKLMAQDSIHTIKEDDFNKEEDETLHEESRELRKSPESPGRRVPQSQLDIPFTIIRHQDNSELAM